MSALVWDEVGSHFYETGLDRGVLYVPTGSAVPWNGLISVSEKSDGGALTSHYIDGQKYADLLTGENYRATLEAFTYPEEFEQFNGFSSVMPGFIATRQSRRTFGLSYRTKVGNDLSGDLGYKIHLIYNATALPTEFVYNTLSNDPDAARFSWDIVAVPVSVGGKKPTAHIIIDSLSSSPEALEIINLALYGDETHDAYLPTPTEFLTLLEDYWLIIVDNEDGTWSATGPAAYFTVNTVDEFQIVGANATYSDSDTYQVSSTNE